MTHFSLPMQQSPQALNLLSALLDDIVPQLIVEIGTGDGGLTCLLGLWAHGTGAQLVTFDNARPRSEHVETLFSLLRVISFKDDCFDKVEFIKGIFESNRGRCLVLCDGGNKPKEMTTFGPMLSSGDVIMAHDYAPTVDAFYTRYKDRIWRSCEICNNSIPPDFVVYAPEMAAGGWLCLRHL